MLDSRSVSDLARDSREQRMKKSIEHLRKVTLDALVEAEHLSEIIDNEPVLDAVVCLRRALAAVEVLDEQRWRGLLKLRCVRT
jgi:hypothetical protein